MEVFEVGPCDRSFNLGFQIGQRFSGLIQSRISADHILQGQLRPFAQSDKGRILIHQLTHTNQNRFQQYWDELVGTAEGSSTSILDITLINFRKEILPFIPKTDKAAATTPKEEEDEICDDCSDVLVVNDTLALVAHNEDANIALVGHTYLIKATLADGHSFTAYTYAGELPSCAFGFNSHGLAFTLDSVPPTEAEIVAGAIGRNFVSRDLLEATSIDDALSRIRSAQVSVGHCYNLIDIHRRKILNVETASLNRISVHTIDGNPFFHANMYLHLHIPQVQDENSITRQERAALLPKESKDDFLSLLGNTDDKEYPIYMEGPKLYTLCTAVFDMDARTLSIIKGNPRQEKVVCILHIM